ncbi:unnamed protein product [Diatraea saccharalis]|uniref:Uncharacterized protein n=1 Tax=Diatraea saccharalis TaxID=40085 RepID=A0A9N9REL4_9NEOP|nr:unnamed protein product [Diatraea saccharalis]
MLTLRMSADRINTADCKMMDTTCSDSENDEVILDLCKQLNIKVPSKNKKPRNITTQDLENINIANLPVQILPDFLPVYEEQPQQTSASCEKQLQETLPISCEEHPQETASTSCAEQPQETASNSCEEQSQETASASCENQAQEIALISCEEQPQETASTSCEEQPQETASAGKQYQNQTSDVRSFVEPQQETVSRSSDDEYGDLNSNRKRSLKRFGDPNKWDKSVTKNKRMKGEEYIGYRRDKKVKRNEKFKVLHDIQRPAREMGPKCTSTFCNKSKVRGCSSLNDDERQNIFSKFWKHMTWEQRKQRSDSKQYFLSTSIGRIQVCMQTFLRTLGLKESTVRCWMSSSEHGIAKSSTSNEHQERIIKKEDLAFLKEFFASLPKMPSHYCRANTSKQYLEPIIEDKTKLYKLYGAECEKAERAPVSRWTVNRVFDELNLSLFTREKRSM